MPRRSKASSGRVPTGGRGTSSGPCESARTGPARCSPSARRATRRSRGRPTRPRAYASTSSMPASRSSFLGFQPPAVGDDEIAAVAETIRSGWLTTGPKAKELEERFAEYLDAKHVLALSSGTAALHLSLVALGVGPGDEVITSPITWPATANVDKDRRRAAMDDHVRDSDLNIDPERVADAVTERTKAIVPVHLAGQPCELEALWSLRVP